MSGAPGDASTPPLPAARTLVFIGSDFAANCWLHCLLLGTLGLPLSQFSSSSHVLTSGRVVFLQLSARVGLHFIHDQHAAYVFARYVAFAGTNLFAIALNDFDQETCATTQGPLSCLLVPVVCVLHNLCTFLMLCHSPMAVAVAVTNHYGHAIKAAFALDRADALLFTTLFELIITVPSALLAIGSARARRMHFAVLTKVEALAQANGEALAEALAEATTVDLWKLAEARLPARPLQPQQGSQQPPHQGSQQPPHQGSQLRCRSSAHSGPGAIAHAPDVTTPSPAPPGFDPTETCPPTAEAAADVDHEKASGQTESDDQVVDSFLDEKDSEAESTPSITRRLLEWDVEREKERQAERNHELLTLLEARLKVQLPFHEL